MKNLTSQLPQQISPKQVGLQGFQKKRESQNRQFTELLQKNQSLVQILDQQSQRCYEYPQVDVDKLRSNASFRSLKNQNPIASPKINYSPIDVIKLKDILNAPRENRPKQQVKQNELISDRALPKIANGVLTFTNIQVPSKPKQPFKKQDKQFIENVEIQEEKQFRVPSMGDKLNEMIQIAKENESASQETPRFFGMEQK